MKLHEYQVELENDAQDRINSILGTLDSIDFKNLQERKVVFDYLVARTDPRFTDRFREFDDIIAVVNYFSEQIPDFQNLSESFIKKHKEIIQKTFSSAEDKKSVNLKNPIVIEKDESLSRVIETSAISYAAILNTEELVNDFLSVFVSSATEIYDALIGLITDSEKDHGALKKTIYDHFGRIVPSLDLLKADRFEEDQS